MPKHSILRKCIAVVLALTLFAGLMPISALAADHTQIVVSQTYATPGDTIAVSVVLNNNAGISNILMSLHYDDALSLIAVSKGDALSTLMFTKPRVMTSPCNFMWEPMGDDDTSNGTILVLTFAVSENASAGEFYDVEFVCSYGDISNGYGDVIDVDMVAGGVEVIDYSPGDVNGDGTINGIDVSILRRYLVGDAVTVNALAADVNSDGRLNGIDVVLIRRWLVGGYGVELKPGKAACTHLALEAVEAVEADCETDGNRAYWYCAGCDTCFADQYAAEPVDADSILIPAFGHNEVVSPAVAPTYSSTGLTEGLYCDLCGKVIKEQEVIPALAANTYSITYRELYGAANLQPTSYSEHEGVLDLPVPERNGYVFLGWYTASTGGEVVDYIPKGSTQDYILFARWEKEVYDIYYFEAPENHNPTTYTVDDSFTLTTPKWSGLMFTGWTDQYGNEVTSIQPGTTGDLELTANWKRMRNLATPKNSKGLLMTYDEDAGRYYFIYELGVIEHVVLEEISVGYTSLKYNSGATDLEFTLETSVTISDTVADTIAHTVSESISQSKEWERSTEWGEETSNEHEVSVSASAEFGIGPVSTTVETSYGYTNTSSESWGKSETKSGSVEIEGSNTQSSASTVTYMREISNTVETGVTISKDMPTGYYSYVHAGNVRVFGIVTYDPAANTFYLDTYSVLDNMHEMLLYYRDVNELNDQSSETLPFDIPRDRILEIVDDSYFVQYNHNDADSGRMTTTMHKVGEAFTFPANSYQKAGHSFGHWSVDDGATAYLEGATVQGGLGSKGQMVTVNLNWSKKLYTLINHANLPENAVGELENWENETECLFEVDVTLPSPTLLGWTLEGWYLDPECTQRLGSPGEVLPVPDLADELYGTVDIYAKWTVTRVRITCDPNGGRLAFAHREYIRNYGDYYDLSITPTRTNFAFVGWYVGDELITDETRVLITENHTVVARWESRTDNQELKPKYKTPDPDEKDPNTYRFLVTTEGGSVYEGITVDLNVDTLAAVGLQNLEVELTVAAVGPAALEVWICNGNKERIASQVYGPGYWMYSSTTHTYRISASDLGEGNVFYLEYVIDSSETPTAMIGETTLTIRSVL